MRAHAADDEVNQYTLKLGKNLHLQFLLNKYSIISSHDFL